MQTKELNMLIMYMGMELNLHKTICHFLVVQLQDLELNISKYKKRKERIEIEDIKLKRDYIIVRSFVSLKLEFVSLKLHLCI